HRTFEFRHIYLEPLGITALMDVPIWVRGSLWGVVCHEQVDRPRRWSEADRDFALSIGHILSNAVEARERADAERTAKLSELFIGVLSHDLRNPLGTIRMSAEYILQQNPGTPSATAAQRIVRNSDRMGRMI